MFRLFLLFVLILSGTNLDFRGPYPANQVRAQHEVLRSKIPQSYTNDDGDTHLVGPLLAADLQREPYAEWYAENADLADPLTEVPAWASRLNDVQVTIFLGTWCGDSKTWVPRFVTLWESLGLDPDQLDFVGLYAGDERYKQGPNHEEAGRQIHRVPTFIFERAGEEVARIVERPRTDLLTDVAQIALGYPAEPRYAAANYLLDLLAETSVDSINAHLQEHFRTIRRDVSSLSELNTLGNVLKATGDAEATLIAFRVNAAIFPYHPVIVRKYAAALEATGELEAALERYERVLEINAEDASALTAVADLRTRLGKTSEGN